MPLPDVSIEEYEGPFDLLITLAEQSRIDLSVISLAELTDKYLSVIESQQLPDTAQADFLVVAATLLLLKVRQLLPEQPADEEATAQALSDRVRMYQQYREQALRIKSQWRPALLPGAPRLAVDYDVPLPAVTSKQLMKYLVSLIHRTQRKRSPTRHLRLQGKTLSECVALLRSQLGTRPTVIFQEVLAGESASTTAVSFLAVLELARQRQLQIEQRALFAPLKLSASFS